MKVSRRGFLKGVGASAVGGLLLSRPEALAHPLVSPEDKKAIEDRPSRAVAQVHPVTQVEQGPEYVLWQGRLYYVTDWQRTMMVDHAEISSWEGASQLVHGDPGEELRLGATLVK